jgi:hypothetical protein
MVTLVGQAAVAENNAQAAQSSRNNDPYHVVVPAISIGGKKVNPSHNFAENMRKWRIMRDCYAGELKIKAEGERYLRRPSNVEPKDYESYKARGYYYNATRRTHTGLLGAMTRKKAEVEQPTGLNLDMSNVTIDGMSWDEFVTDLESELILIGRIGVLADISAKTPAGTIPEPYFATYRAESIYAIRQRLYKGRKIIDRVVLLEDEEAEDDYSVTTKQIVRVLRLDPIADSPTGKLRYWQQVIRPAPQTASGYDKTNFTAIEDVNVRPQGRELDYIPFVVFNARTLLPDSEDPPMLDLAHVNLSHYESTAQLEHGRFYAGMPTYYIAGAGMRDELDPENTLGTANPMTVGPSNVWMLEQGDKCGLLEFTGHGLTFLENAVDSKQLQIHSLGGKLIPTQRKAAALSAEAYGLMEAGDEATLLDIALTAERGLTLLLHYANDLRNNPRSNKGLVELNKEFIRSELTAREVRAIQTLYERGLIPLDVLYYTLRQIGIIPYEYSLEDFKTLLGTSGQVFQDPNVKLQQDRLALDKQTAADEQRLAEEAARTAARIAANPPAPAPAPNSPPSNPGA